jgi:hypothetical protein
MDLFENPFHILGVGPTASRERMTDAADAASLSMDPDLVAEAASALANPRRRLYAEVCFLPGLDEGAIAFQMKLLSIPVKTVPAFSGMPDAAIANLTAASLARLEGTGPEKTAEAVILLSRAFGRITPESLMEAVNADRKVAGVPGARSLSDVEEELDRLRLHFRKVVRDALDRLPSSELVDAAASVVRSETQDGRMHPPVLVRDLLEIYDLETREFFELERKNVEALAEILKNESGSGKAGQVAGDLETVIRNWGAVAAPLIMASKATGVSHRPSQSVAAIARNAAVDFYNKGGDAGIAIRITALLSSVFANEAEICAQLARDAQILQNSR